MWKNILKNIWKYKISQLLFFFFYKVVSTFFKKYRHPIICSFKITLDCNLRCMHCPFWRVAVKSGPDNNGRLLSFKEIKKILTGLKKDGVKIVIFEGGEPLLWKDMSEKKDIKDVISYARKLFYFTGVTTNGTIDLKNISCDVIFVSIDGLKSMQDKLRGKSFDKIIENISLNKNKKIIANICISKANKDEIFELVRFLNDKVYGITIQFFYPYGGLPDLALTGTEKISLINGLLELKKNNYRILNSSDGLISMKDKSWKCLDFLVANVESDGRISYGCYLQGKTDDVSCSDCGFAVHCEISLAYSLNLSAINAARKIFW
jgi:Fe-coproporphyrin III synthase